MLDVQMRKEDPGYSHDELGSLRASGIPTVDRERLYSYTVLALIGVMVRRWRAFFVGVYSVSRKTF
jgi:hypothetical protein